MKTAKTLFGIFTIMATFVMTGRCQIYQFSAPITGSLTMGVSDNPTPPYYGNGCIESSGGYGTFSLNFTNLSETIYLDPINGTLRQVGTISYAPATNIQWDEIQGGLSASITVNLAPSGGNLTFDTGPQTTTWDTGSGAYTVPYEEIFANGLPISGTYSLATGGQTYNGVFSYRLSEGGEAYNLNATPSTFRTFSLTNYPFSLQLNGLGNGYAPYYQSPGIVASITASNGFQMVLVPGSYCLITCQYIPCHFQGEIFSWASDSVIATNVGGTATSITVTAQPQSVLDHAFGSASFSVTASGIPPLTYQWTLNGSNIPGGMSGTFNSTLTVTNVTQRDLGEYAVTVSDFGSASSSNATLSMYPFIVNPFTGAVIYWGQGASLGLQAWGTGPLKYQWFQNGVALSNGTNQTLSLTNIQTTNAGLYSVVVSNVFGSVTNLPAPVIVEPAGVSLVFPPTLIISGVTGYSYIIQSTTNLANTNAWVTMTNLMLTQPVQPWVDLSVDASSPFNPTHFYRVLPGQ